VKIPVVARRNIEYFSFSIFANLYSEKLKNLNHVSISDFGKTLAFLFLVTLE
jgi:hypothetical protein